jgi:hypothetical protein
MGVFMPPTDSCDIGATRVWLVVGMVALAVAGIALLAQAALLWRRESRLGVAWWGRLPLALPVVWAAVCGFAAVRAVTDFAAAKGYPPCPPGTECINPGGPACLPAPPLTGPAQLILLVAAVLLILGGLALARLPRGRDVLVVIASRL